jgi:hypothetical protein
MEAKAAQSKSSEIKLATTNTNKAAVNQQARQRASKMGFGSM